MHLGAALEDAFVKVRVRSRVCQLAEGSLQTMTVASLGETTEIGVEERQRPLRHFQPFRGPGKGNSHVVWNGIQTTRLRSFEPRVRVRVPAGVDGFAVDQELAHSIEGGYCTTPERPTRGRDWLSRRDPPM